MSESEFGPRLRAGALFFITLSLGMFSFILMSWNGYLDLFHIVMVALAIIYFVGGTIVLKRNERKGMFAIFVVNLVIFVLLLAFFLLALYAYLTDPCYIDPMSCDDQLTDYPTFLKGLGILTGILASITFLSWRLKRSPNIVSGEE